MKTYSAKPLEVERKWYVIDADGETLGRLAVRIANILRGKNKPEYTPNVDTGDFVIVINAAKVKVTGKKETDKIYFVELKEDIDDEYDDFADDLELGNCYDCCCHHDCVDCDMDDEEYVNVTLPKEDIETLHMLCRIFKV